MKDNIKDAITDQIEKEKAYNNYLKYFTNERGYELLYENLYRILDVDLEITKQTLGDYYFERFIFLLSDSLDKIEEDIKGYAELIFDVDSIDYGYLFHFKPKLENRLLQLMEQLKQAEAVKTDEKFKTENLFKVGLLFATGEMNKYFTIKGNNEIVANNGLSPLKIATELGNPSFEKIILASKNNYPTNNTNGNKNIFNNLDMMNKIISDCEAKNIPVEPYFISRLPIE